MSTSILVIIWDQSLRSSDYGWKCGIANLWRLITNFVTIIAVIQVIFLCFFVIFDFHPVALSQTTQTVTALKTQQIRILAASQTNAIISSSSLNFHPSCDTAAGDAATDVLCTFMAAPV